MQLWSGTHTGANPYTEPIPAWYQFQPWNQFHFDSNSKWLWFHFLCLLFQFRFQKKWNHNITSGCPLKLLQDNSFNFFVIGKTAKVDYLGR